MIDIKREKDFEKKFKAFSSRPRLTTHWTVPRLSLKNVCDISYRTINYWTTCGLIDDNRENKKQWRKFSPLDAFWIYIIEELHSFGFSNEKILKTKKSFYKITHKNNNPLMEFYLGYSHAKNGRISYLLVLNDGHCDIATIDELNASAKQEDILTESLLLISINKIISRIFKKEIFTKNFQINEDPTVEELDLIQIIRDKRFKKIEIKTMDGKMHEIHTHEEATNKKIVDLINEARYQEIRVIVADGKAVYTERTIKNKISY